MSIPGKSHHKPLIGALKHLILDPKDVFFGVAEDIVQLGIIV